MSRSDYNNFTEVESGIEAGRRCPYYENLFTDPISRAVMIRRMSYDGFELIGAGNVGH